MAQLLRLKAYHKGGLVNGLEKSAVSTVRRARILTVYGVLKKVALPEWA